MLAWPAPIDLAVKVCHLKVVHLQRTPCICKLFGVVVAAAPHDEHANENAEHDAAYPHQNAPHYKLRVVAGPAILTDFVRSDKLGSFRWETRVVEGKEIFHELICSRRFVRRHFVACTAHGGKVNAAELGVVTAQLGPVERVLEEPLFPVARYVEPEVENPRLRPMYPAY
eukprot:CAMPEP_0119522326 /NCGR_PEP_ID=MMETSP1344-20130328/37737_1 /TAXON_ID=236787 /ORGANISM="Florenciella parvula, Strain CCMP2471" /LENGTH=169 /DNA_ID=CAMNT_0007560359 /DNA_START=113 /DNA_END=621 /DNA_ORIENTATION=+